jgi:hypothetical protein
MVITMLLFGVLSGAWAQEPTATPVIQAQQIAEGSAMVRSHLEELKKEASKIQDKVLRDSALEFLAAPKFRLASRKTDEVQIRKALLSKGLIEVKNAPSHIIPEHQPMPFVAAPASVWTMHHTYPGGLVFHTLTNLRNAISLGVNWEEVNKIHLRYDWLRAAPIWHDIAKTWVIEWNADGTATPSEGQIAGTGSHHILGIAEALMRDLPSDFVVVVASAHQPAHPVTELQELIRYLQAASIIAGKSYHAAGLTEDGTHLAGPAPLESYLHHLSDHDWVASEVSFKEAVGALKQTYPDLDPWKQDELLSRFGDLRVTQVWRESGSKGLRELFNHDREVR